MCGWIFGNNTLRGWPCGGTVPPEVFTDAASADPFTYYYLPKFGANEFAMFGAFGIRLTGFASYFFGISLRSP